MERAPTEALLLGVIVILFWVIAIIAWWATLWHIDLFEGFGADLPTSTILVKETAKLGAPFAVAGIFSGEYGVRLELLKRLEPQDRKLAV